MKDEDKTKEQLIGELVELRQRITELEASETQQKREKETLKTVSVQWQTTFDAISDAVCLLDQEGMILQGNNAMMQLVGKSSGELLGRTCYELIHGTSKRPEECPVIRMQETCRRENLVLPLDDRWFNVTVDPLLDDDGSINGAVHIIADITERKQAEQELHRERDNFISILESMADGVYIVNQNYDIEYVNSILKQEFGLPEGRKCYVYFHDRKEICPWCKNQEVFAGKTVRWEWYSFKNNKTYDLIDTPIKNPDGSVSKLEIFRDITDRKQAEDEVKKSKQMLEGITHGITESILLLSKDLKIIWANKTALEEYGYELEDILGKHCYMATHSQESPCEPPLDPCPIYELQETDTPQTQTHIHADTEGNKKFVEVSAYPVKDEKGEVAQFVYVSKNITEQKRTEKALRVSEERYRSLFEGSRDAIYSTTREGNFVNINQSTLELFGYSREEMLGLNVLEIYFHPENRARFQQEIEKKSSVRDYEVKFRKKDGTEMDCLITSTVRLATDGSILGYQGIVRDITERKKLEQQLKDYTENLEKMVEERTAELQKSEKRFRDLAELLPETVYETDTAANITFLNRSGLEKFGYSQEDLDKGLNVVQVVVPEEHEKLKEFFAKRLRGEDGTTEYMVQRKDGSRFPIIIVSRPILDDESNLVGLRGIVIDVTERKRAEDALRESEELYRTLVKTSPDAVTATDLEGRITEVSQRTLELYGFEHTDELLGKNSIDFITPEHRERAILNLQKTVSEGIVRNLEYNMLKNDGSRFIGELSASLIKDQHGNPKGFIATTRDITERKKLEEMRSNFINVAAHEIRTPVSAMKAHVDLLNIKRERGLLELPDEAHKTLGIITRNMTGLITLINNLLDFTRLEAGKVGMKMELSSIEFQASQAIKEILPLATKKDHQIDLHLPTGLLPMMMDEDLMKAILKNLLSNAIKYTPEGGSINVVIQEEGDCIHITVKDTGIGIPKEDLDKIFRPFHVVDISGSVLERSYIERTGLGLAITKEYVKMHDGSIWVESRIGEGSMFHVLFPIKAR